MDKTTTQSTLSIGKDRFLIREITTPPTTRWVRSFGPPVRETAALECLITGKRTSIAALLKRATEQRIFTAAFRVGRMRHRTRAYITGLQPEYITPPRNTIWYSLCLQQVPELKIP